MISAESKPVHYGTEGHRVIVQDGWRLTAILNAIKVVSTGQKLDAVLDRVLSRLIETWAAAETGAFLPVDPASGKLVVVASRGYECSSLQGMRIGRGEAIAITLSRSRSPALWERRTKCESSLRYGP